MDWLIVIGAVLVAVWAYIQYRRAQGRVETFRTEARRRMQELASLGYSENKVGRRVAAMGEASLDLILVFKSDHSVIYLNPAAESLFGKLPEVNRSVIAVTRNHEIDDLASEALAERDDLDRQFFVNNRAYRARAATFEGGGVICLSDVSELQRLGRARRDFIANISHELRTPLTAIRLLTDTLKSPAGQNPEMALNLIDKIAVETEALSQLAQELLDLSAIESGQVVMKMVTCPVRPVVEGASARLAEFTARKRLSRLTGAPGNGWRGSGSRSKCKITGRGL